MHVCPQALLSRPRLAPSTFLMPEASVPAQGHRLDHCAIFTVTSKGGSQAGRHTLMGGQQGRPPPRSAGGLLRAGNTSHLPPENCVSETGPFNRLFMCKALQSHHRGEQSLCDTFSSLNDRERNGLEGAGEREAVSLPPGNGGPRSPLQEAPVRHGAGFPRLHTGPSGPQRRWGWPSSELFPLHPAQKTRAPPPQPLAGWPASQASPGMRGEGPRVLWSTARRASTDQHAPEPARGVREPGLARGAAQTAATSLHAGPLFLIPRSRT